MAVRPADPARDYRAYAEIVNACEPRATTAEALREEDEATPADEYLRRFVAEAEGQIVGAGASFRCMWDPPSTGRVAVWVRSDFRRRGVGARIAAVVEEVGASFGMRRLVTSTSDQEAAARRFAEVRGFAVRAHCYESLLDLAGFDPSCFAHWVLPAGVRAFAVSETAMDEAVWRRLWDLNTETSCDEPSNDPDHRPSFEQFYEGVVRARWFDPALQIVAASGDEWVGISAVDATGHENLFTGVRRAHRGRGIAKALKLAALTRAKALGAEFVRTDNDSRNAPMLAINAALGYVPEPGVLKWSKELT